VVAAGLLALLGAAYGGFEYARWQAAGRGGVLEANLAHSPSTTAAQTDRALLETDANACAARSMRPRDRRKSIAAAEAEAARKAYAEAEERRKEQERAHIAAAALEADERATFVKRVQMVLKQGRCHDGAVSGRSVDAQDGLDRFVAAVGQRGNANVTRIELAKATAADFEAWLREARGQRTSLRPQTGVCQAGDRQGARTARCGERATIAACARCQAPGAGLRRRPAGQRWNLRRLDAPQHLMHGQRRAHMAADPRSVAPSS
jgi:hypothetical protein